MISVVIPLYNKEKQIAYTLQSVFEQTFQDFEIVVVDDGSTDNSVEEVEKFDDSRIRLIHQTNAGVSAARNRGIEEARGELIAFLDADDEWMPEYLATQYGLYQKYPECSVYACNYEFRDSEGKVTPTIIRKLPFEGEDGVLSNYFEVASCSHPPICSISIMVKKTAIQAIGGFPLGIKSGEDLLTWARLAVNEKFAEKYPSQFNSWKATEKGDKIIYADEQDPRLIVLWGGYSFAKEYNAPRGHVYAVKDVRDILRTGAPKTATDGPQPMACWTCKGPDVPRLIAEWGEDGYFGAKWAKGGAEIVNSIGCADCHDTTSKDFAEGKPALRIARPHVLRALDHLNNALQAKAKAEGKEQPNLSFNTAARTEKRAEICANCHVEYYFAGDLKQVTFPWDNGQTVDDIEKYYDDIGFSDWTHSLSKAPMLKAQHPDFEIWSLGMHGKNGVTCIDCHMPKVQGKDGKVYTDHQIQNPFDAFDSTCANCHDQSKEKLKDIVASRKKEVKDVMGRLEDQVVRAHFEAKAAWDAGATKEEMEPALMDIRHAQWRWDYAAASHGGHMHAPDVMLRVLGSGLDKAADARAKLAAILTKHGVKTPVEVPDISTADKAWKVMGIDIEKERKAKKEFLETVVPQWVKEAKANGKLAEDTATKQ